MLLPLIQALKVRKTPKMVKPLRIGAHIIYLHFLKG